VLFVDRQGGQEPSGSINLLGRYDMICVRAHADFDKDWHFLKGPKQPFWVLHAAAINIGETASAPDFRDFTSAGVLDVDAYINAMGHLIDKMVAASSAVGAQHLVFFPFGMGAFLRNLHSNDRSFEGDALMQMLRRRLADRFAQGIGRAAQRMAVHVCLQFGAEEALMNADAFIRALAALPPVLKQQVALYPEGDCLQLAHELASTSAMVLLVNGANRQLIGNHWFAGRAKRAIDENLHRRSWTLSAQAYLLNRFGERGEMEGSLPRRDTNELRVNTTVLGGRIMYL